MKVGIHSPYLTTMGGGERYVFSVAQFFLQHHHSVDIFVGSDFKIDDIKNRFGLDLTGVNLVQDFFSSENFFSKLISSASYDLIFFLSDGSIPTSFARRNILHFQVPFKSSDEVRISNRLKLTKYQLIVCNSLFTKEFIDQTYDVSSKVLYPPVDVSKFTPSKKEKIIMSVGRFFAPSHPKKQKIMIDVFKNMVDDGLKGWKLLLIGGITEQSQDDISRLRKTVLDYQIEIVTDSNFKFLQNAYSKASIYWHAAGFGEDLENHPDRAEHFGMSTVESMAAGCVPIVFFGWGQKEIITESVNGFFWQTKEELAMKTKMLIEGINLFENISKKAMRRSADFSKESFFNKFNSLVHEI